MSTLIDVSNSNSSTRRKILREQQQARTTQEKLEAEQIREIKRNAIFSDAVDFIELIIIGGIIYLLRKPLGKVLRKLTGLIEQAIENQVERVEEKLLEWEMKQRLKVYNTYFQNPYYGAFMGGELYQQLIVNGQWHIRYTSIKNPPPSAMKPVFIVGTGLASYWTDSNLIHLTSLEMEALIRFLVEGSGDVGKMWPSNL